MIINITMIKQTYNNSKPPYVLQVPPARSEVSAQPRPFHTPRPGRGIIIIIMINNKVVIIIIIIIIIMMIVIIIIIIIIILIDICLLLIMIS